VVTHRFAGQQRVVVKRATLAVVLLASALVTAAGPEVIIIGHRGASGHRPEHTIESYTLAIAMGADYIEPDLVSTKDGVLVARHENEIGDTTDVAVKFPARKATKTIDGQAVTGWFTEDFTLAEIRTLRAKERLPFRSHERDGMYPIPTFDEVLALADAKSKETGRTIGIYPETKHPSYFRSIGLPLEPPLLETLSRHGKRAKSDAVFIQSFEPANLRLLRPQTQLRLVLLLEATADVSPARLAEIRTFADGIGPNTRLIVPANADGTLREPTSLVADAHQAGLLVHVWTLRSEAAFLSPTYGGDPMKEHRQFASLGVDGIFTDFPDVAFAALRK
jgi:glycerophosphoryl diester phosphodiesterase